MLRRLFSAGRGPGNLETSGASRRDFGSRRRPPVPRRILLGLEAILRSRALLFLEAGLLFLLLFPLAERLASAARPLERRPALAALLAAAAAMGGVPFLRRAHSHLLQFGGRWLFPYAHGVRVSLLTLLKDIERYSVAPVALSRHVCRTFVEAFGSRRAALFLRKDLLLRLPLQGEVEHLVLRGARGARPGDFLCLVRTAGSEGGDVPEEETCPGLLLREGSAAARRLAAMDGRPAEVLEPSDLLLEPGGEGAGLDEGAEVSALAGCDLRLLVPLSCHQKVVGFVALGPRPGEEPFGRGERDLLLAVGNQVAAALAYAGSVREEAERLFLLEDMAQARKVQQRILPQECRHAEGLRTASRFRPARGVAGDTYDFIPFSDGSLGVALGDVAGKGMAAALLMASLQAMLRVHADAHRSEVERLAADVNRQLCTVTDPNRFASLFYGVYDPAGRTFTYINAGHHPGLLLRSTRLRTVGAQAAAPRFPDEKPEVVPLSSTGMVLGVLPDAVFGRETLRFEPGDLLVLYTDGLLDAVNGEGRRFGEEGLERAILRHRRLNPEALCEALLAEVAAFCGEVPPPDDMTLVILRAA